MADMPDPLVPDMVALMPREFGLEPTGFASLDEVKRFLVGRITVLLDRNPALLMSILYRIDVPEPKVQRALRGSPPGALAADLADLIIERQVQKARLRQQYRAGSPDVDR